MEYGFYQHLTPRHLLSGPMMAAGLAPRAFFCPADYALAVKSGGHDWFRFIAACQLPHAPGVAGVDPSAWRGDGTDPSAWPSFHAAAHDARGDPSNKTNRPTVRVRTVFDAHASVLGERPLLTAAPRFHLEGADSPASAGLPRVRWVEAVAEPDAALTLGEWLLWSARCGGVDCAYNPACVPPNAATLAASLAPEPGPAKESALDLIYDRLYWDAVVAPIKNQPFDPDVRDGLDEFGRPSTYDLTPFAATVSLRAAQEAALDSVGLWPIEDQALGAFWGQATRRQFERWQARARSGHCLAGNRYRISGSSYLSIRRPRTTGPRRL